MHNIKLAKHRNELRKGVVICKWVCEGAIRGFICRGLCHGPLARYVKLRVAHEPGIPGTFSPPPRVSDPDMHHGTCATHVPWCMPGSLTSGLLWSWWRRKRSRHSRRIRNPQFYVSGKRPLATSPALVVRSIQSCAIHIAHILLWICDGHFRCRLCSSTHYFKIVFYKKSEGKNGMKKEKLYI